MKKIIDSKKNKIVKNLKLKENLDRFVTYYTGETINRMPHGKGTSETYDLMNNHVSEMIRSIR